MYAEHNSFLNLVLKMQKNNITRWAFDQWESETKWTMNFFREKNLFNKDSIVLDWGCGIGRLKPYYRGI